MTARNANRQVKNIFGDKTTPSKTHFILKLFTLGQSPVNLALDASLAERTLNDINDALADGYFRINLESGTYNVPYALLNRICSELKFFISVSIDSNSSHNIEVSSVAMYRYL